MSAHQKSKSSSSNATPPPLGYVNREDARNLEAGTLDCMLVMREHNGRFERPVYSRPEQANVGEIGFGAVVPTASERAGRIYVAGPMSGIADFNFPVFNAAAAMLRYSGWTVENPAEHALADNLEWADYMAYDLTRLGLCGAIYLLPGWSTSRGAKIEKSLAAELGMDIRFDPNAEQGSDRVEVVGYEHVTFTGLQVVTDKDHPPVIRGSKWKTPVELVAHAHVTRLQAKVSALQQRLNIAEQRVDDLEKDKQRIDALETNFWDVRHHSTPLADTGDYTGGVEIVGRWMDKPHERVIGEDYNESLRAAIDQAMTADAYPPARPEYPEIDAALSEESWHMNPCKQGTATSAHAGVRPSVTPATKRSLPPPRKKPSSSGTLPTRQPQNVTSLCAFCAWTRRQ